MPLIPEQAAPTPVGDRPAQESAPHHARRVLLVTARFAPYIGGTETHTYEMARRLVALGHDITVLTTDPSGRLPSEESIDRVRVVRVSAWPANRDYYFAPAIVPIIANGHWDIVHCQGYHTLVAPLAMLTAWRKQIPYLVSFHSGGYSAGVRNAARLGQWLLLRPLLARARRLIAVSQFEAALFQRRLRFAAGHITIVPNGSELPLGARATHDSEHPMIVSVGRLEQYKGHHRVIAALPGLAQHYPGIRLRIIGKGPYEAALRQLAAELGVAERVEIAAIASDDRQGMARTLAQATLVTLLSEYESQGIAPMEALALGRPVLVTTGTALRELVERGLARGVAPSSTTEEIVAAMVEQLQRPLIPARVTLPTWDTGAATLSALYQTILPHPQRNTCES